MRQWEADTRAIILISGTHTSGFALCVQVVLSVCWTHNSLHSLERLGMKTDQVLLHQESGGVMNSSRLSMLTSSLFLLRLGVISILHPKPFNIGRSCRIKASVNLDKYLHKRDFSGGDSSDTSKTLGSEKDLYRGSESLDGTINRALILTYLPASNLLSRHHFLFSYFCIILTSNKAYKLDQIRRLV